MEENNNEQVIVDIGLDALIASLQGLQAELLKTKAKVADLDAQLEKGEITQEEYNKAIIQNTQEQKVWQQQIKSAEKSIQNEIKAQNSQKDSLVQLRAQLANLNKQYDSMSGFERASTAGEALRKKIKALSDNISSLEANTGRYQRNVGNYKSALENLTGGFKAAGLSTKGLDQSLKLLNGNPIMLFLTAIVTVVRQLIQAFKGNEQATMALKQAFSAFNPFIDAAKRGLEAFANVIVKVVTGAVNGLTSAIGWLLDKVQDIGNFFGADWHMGDNFRAGAEAARELQQAENDYIKNKRSWSVESAKIDREVADLREKAADKEQYNAQQRLDFMDKAIALETKKAEKEKQLAQQNLENLRLEAQRSANSAEMNDKLAEAERAVIEADTRLADTKRTLNKQRQASIREINGEADAVSNYTQKVRELRQELELIKALSIDELIEANAKKNKDLADNIRPVIERVGLLTEELDKLPSAEELFGDIVDVTDENLKDSTTKFELFAEAFRNNADLIENTASSLESSFGSIASMYKTMANDEKKSEEEREKSAKRAKRWSALQIAANSGTAIAKGVASAMDVPWPANLAAIASVMAAVIAAIAQAKALAAEGHEHGGVLGNKFVSPTMGKDNMIFAGRKGEMVLNADQQKKLFDIANGGSSSNLTASLVEALQSMPAPVLDYQEFVRFQQRVVTMNENSKLQ